MPPEARPTGSASVEVRQTGGLDGAAAHELAVLEARARSAEERAVAAEDALAAAQAEIVVLREECERLRASLSGLREECECPILHGPCEDPVVASDGKTYERQAIEDWLRRHGTSPLTRAKLLPALFPNHMAAAVLRQLRKSGMISESDEEEDEERMPVGPGSLLTAIRAREKAQALKLLRRKKLPGLAKVDRESGGTVLHWAIQERLPEVALAILGRSDFKSVNSENRLKQTALMLAASSGSLPICEGILQRADFVKAQARDIYGLRAVEWAKDRAVVERLQSAEVP